MLSIRRRALFSFIALAPALALACGGDDLIRRIDDDAGGDASGVIDATISGDSAKSDAADSSTKDANDSATEDANADGGDSASHDAQIDVADSAAACVPAPVHTTGSMATNEQIDALHSGYQPLDTLGTPLCPRWTHDFGAPATSPVLVADTFVYVNVNASFTSGNGLYALASDSGNRQWGPVSGISGESFDSIAYDGLRIYAVSASDRVYAFDTSGNFLWVRSLSQGNVGSKLTTKNGLIYVIGEQFGANLYVVDAAGNLVWTSPQLLNGTNGAPTVSSTAAYVDLGFNDIAAFDRLDGGALWSVTGSQAGGSNVTMPLLGTKLYSVGYEPLFGSLLLNAADGTDAGTFASTTSPAWNGTLVFTTDVHTVFATDPATSSSAWSYTDTETIASAPLVVGSKVIVAMTTGKVVALDASSGALVSTSSAPSGLPGVTYGRQTTLSAANGQLYVPTAAGLTAF